MANELNAEKPADMSIDDLRKAVAGEEAKPAAEAPNEAETPAAETPAEEKPAVVEETPSDKKETPDPGDGKETQERDEKGKFKAKTTEVPDAVQKRINKAIWEKHQTERRAEAAERRAQELERKLAEKEQAPGKPAEVKPSDASDTEPVEPQEDKFDSYSDYLKANAKYTRELASWQYRQDRKADLAAQAKKESDQKAADAAKAAKAVDEGWNARVAKVREADPMVDEAIANVGDMLSQSGHAGLIKRSLVGPEIVLYMHEHADETMKVIEDVQSLGNDAITLYIGRIEARLAASRPETPAPKTEIEKPQALPKPVASVAARSSVTKTVDVADPKVPTDVAIKELRRLVSG